MKHADEIKKYVENIQYYAKLLDIATKKQIGEDMDIGKIHGVNEYFASIRFNCLGAVNNASIIVDNYCSGMIENVKKAELQDEWWLNDNKS